ncbi:MAG: alcohol dehydrogenase, partial [Chloroflexota bacterium]|nr:alcohol dehydrogenase [Chloroflexota bacterium]
TYARNLEFDASALVVNEITLIGSRCGPFAPILRLLSQSLIDPALLVDYSYPLSDGLEAFKKAAEHGVFKVLLTV